MVSAFAVAPRCLAASGRPALARPSGSRRLVLRPQGRASDVHMAGEHREVLEEMAASDDILHHYTTEYQMAAHATKKYKKLRDLMQTNLVTAAPDEPLAEVEARLRGIEGAPVVDAAGKLVGVLSKKDFKKPGATVKDVMTATPIACKAGDKVTAAAHAMIDNKIHRVPVVDDDGKVVGIVTRTDLFWELASANDRTEWLEEHGVHV